MMPVETDGGLRVCGKRTDPDEQAVVAPLEQLFTGPRAGLLTLKVQCVGVEPS